MTYYARRLHSMVAPALLALGCIAAPVAAWAEEAPADKVKADGATTTSAPTTTTATSTTSTAPKPKYPPYTDVLKDFKTIDGLVKLYQKETKLYAELSTSQLNKDFIVLTSIARGIGEAPLLGGMTWGFGDDWLWQFRKVDDNIQVVRRNVRFRAAK